MHTPSGNAVAPSVTPQQLSLLHHTMGLSPHQRGENRNYFLAGAGHHDQENLLALVEAGLMSCSAAPKWVGSGDLFRVTDIGRSYAIANLPPMPAPVKYTKYEEYLRADLGCSFAEWLGIEVPRREYQGYRHSTDHHVRLVSSKATGEWGATLKEAKALYKKALDATRSATSRDYSLTSQPA